MKPSLSARWQRRVLAIAAGAALAACSNDVTPRNYVHPALGADQQQADRAECRRRAMDQVEREEQRESPFLAQDQSAMQRLFNQYDAREREIHLYHACLRDKGYAPVVERDRGT